MKHALRSAEKRFLIPARGACWDARCFPPPAAKFAPVSVVPRRDFSPPLADSLPGCGERTPGSLLQGGIEVSVRVTGTRSEPRFGLNLVTTIRNEQKQHDRSP